jgi:hypothetical protein
MVGLPVPAVVVRYGRGRMRLRVASADSTPGVGTKLTNSSLDDMRSEVVSHAVGDGRGGETTLTWANERSTMCPRQGTTFMGPGCGQVGHSPNIGRGEGLGGGVGENEAEASLIGAVIVDLELKGVVELALEMLRCHGDLDVFQDRQGVEQVDVLARLRRDGGVRGTRGRWRRWSPVR